MTKKSESYSRESGGGAPGACPLIFGRQEILKNSFTLICNFTHKRLCKISVSGSLIASYRHRGYQKYGAPISVVGDPSL